MLITLFGTNHMTQVYLSGEEVQLGDRVRCKDDDGKIVALEADLKTSEPI